MHASNPMPATNHLMLIRWFTLANVLILISLGVDRQPPTLFIAVALYCALASALWTKIERRLARTPALLLVDVTIVGVLMAVTGGGWTSSYALYALTSLLIVSFFASVRGTIAFVGYFLVLYTLGIVANGPSLATIEHLDVNLLLTTYIVIIAVAFFFGYPAHIIREIAMVRHDTSAMEARLSKTREMLSALRDPYELSGRELDILSCLSEGKTNKAIAGTLHVSESTVKNHLSRIYKKMGVSSREEAVFGFLSRSPDQD